MTLAISARVDRHRHRPQRRRQDDHARRRDRPAAAGGTHGLRRAPTRRPRRRARIEARLLSRAGEARAVRRSDRRRQPAAGRLRAGAIGPAEPKRPGDVYRRFLRSGRAPQPARPRRCRAASGRCWRWRALMSQAAAADARRASLGLAPLIVRGFSGSIASCATARRLDPAGRAGPPAWRRRFRLRAGNRRRSSFRPDRRPDARPAGDRELSSAGDRSSSWRRGEMIYRNFYEIFEIVRNAESSLRPR